MASIRPGDSMPVRVNPEHAFRVERPDTWPLLAPGIFLAVGLVLTSLAMLLVHMARAKMAPT